MKKMARRILALATIMAVLIVSILPASADFTDKEGPGTNTIVVHNAATTGIVIKDDHFHAYQIFTADDLTSYAVTDAFKTFFVGSDMTAGDGSTDTFDFQVQLDIMNSTESTEIEKEAATTEYNHLAALYMDSYKNNMATLATQIRGFLDENGTYNEGTVECVAHSQAVANPDGSQSAYLRGLTSGYYFVMDQENEVHGLGIAASGAFVPIKSDAVDETITIEVKNSVPTVEKEIFHNDKDKWDVVGDHQIGDKVEFLVTSTLPSNITDYTEGYIYRLTDVMSEGLTYNADVKIYTNFECTDEVPTNYYDVTTVPEGFIIDVHVKELMDQVPALATLYTCYSATLNSNAIVATGHDENTITLEYSNNPSDYTQTGESDSTVFHYTFTLDVNKVDENLAGLAGARFGIFDDSGKALPLQRGTPDENGVVPYYYNEAVYPVVDDGGYITTEAIELADGTSVIGKFQIYGLDDDTTYILREVEAPEGYNKVDDISFKIEVTYNQTGTGITSVTSGSDYIHVDGFAPSTTIMNRKTVFLPETGGMGTVVLQTAGGAMMLGAAMILLNQKKKEK